VYWCKLGFAKTQQIIYLTFKDNNSVIIKCLFLEQHGKIKYQHVSKNIKKINGNVQQIGFSNGNS